MQLSCARIISLIELLIKEFNFFTASISCVAIRVHLEPQVFSLAARQLINPSRPTMPSNDLENVN